MCSWFTDNVVCKKTNLDRNLAIFAKEGPVELQAQR